MRRMMCGASSRVAGRSRYPLDSTCGSIGRSTRLSARARASPLLRSQDVRARRRPYGRAAATAGQGQWGTARSWRSAAGPRRGSIYPQEPADLRAAEIQRRVRGCLHRHAFATGPDIVLLRRTAERRPARCICIASRPRRPRRPWRESRARARWPGPRNQHSVAGSRPAFPIACGCAGSRLS